MKFDIERFSVRLIDFFTSIDRFFTFHDRFSFHIKIVKLNTGYETIIGIENPYVDSKS